jgi:hypothetical protein
LQSKKKKNNKNNIRVLSIIICCVCLFFFYSLLCNVVILHENKLIDVIWNSENNYYCNMNLRYPRWFASRTNGVHNTVSCQVWLESIFYLRWNIYNNPSLLCFILFSTLRWSAEYIMQAKYLKRCSNPTSHYMPKGIIRF